MAPKYSAEWWEKVAARSAQEPEPSEPRTIASAGKSGNAGPEFTRAETKKAARFYGGT